MIKVNLLKSRGGATQTMVDITQTAYGDASSGSFSSDDNKEVLVKCLLMLLGVVALYAYEYSVKSGLNEKRQAVLSQLNQAQQELTQKKAIVAQAENLEKESKSLEGRIEILKKLSQDRLTVVKGLDYIQALIPEKVWLTQLTLEGTELLILGQAMNDEGLSEFIRGVEDAPLFREVVLTQAREVKANEGTVKSFEIRCRMGT